MEISKSDWKLYRAKIADWQENYIEIITFDDLADFSKELQQTVSFLFEKF